MVGSWLRSISGSMFDYPNLTDQKSAACSATPRLTDRITMGILREAEIRPLYIGTILFFIVHSTRGF